MSEQPQEGYVPAWTLGWRLQRALAHAGITVNEIAADLEVSRATVSRWLNDRGAQPRTLYIRQWAMKTGISYEWLCHGSLDPCRPGPGNVLAGGRTGSNGSNYMQSIITGITALRLAA